MSAENTVPVITIDGPSGTGKGTIGKMLATHLGWHYLDSGAIYRVLAFAAQKNGIQHDETEKLVALCSRLKLRFQTDKSHNSNVILDEQDVSHEIRTEQCGQNASKIGAIPEVREALLARQRAFATPPGLATDGRDMGTVVFPNAVLKVYLYATSEERANRRFLQLKESGINASLAQVVDELVKRDARDTERAYSPLKPAKDAVLVDTTDQTIVQVFTSVLQLLDKHLLKS